MKAAFYTLGCKTNQFETQALERGLCQRGFEIAAFEEKADVYVINTCSVTATADKKSRNAIRRARQQNPGAVIAVCGCSCENAGERLMQVCGADIVIGTRQKSRLPQLIEDYIQNGTCVIPPPCEGFDYMPAGGLAGHTRALLKVQDGCRNFCSYCIIPFLRSKLSSLPARDAARDAARLQSEGYREIVITGIEISSYGVDLEEKTELIDLLEAVAEAAPDTRIRLGSLEPRTVTRQWAEKLSRLPNICPHFHLSLQSGCDKTLRDMNRRYDTRRFLESCTYLREFFPDCAVTTDLIVGFPDESEEDFETTLEFLRTFKPAQVHIFPYSRREGTRAANRPNQLTRAQKEARAQKAASVCAQLRREYMEGFIGRELEVLFEQEEKGSVSGYCREYLPVRVKQTGIGGTVRRVLIESADENQLYGVII
ncbi:MAG: tRNA (N(6)-L-threonylcarbamoyladenosine(37)-C(2))-methylthiotransferase MtaB [Clostridia bacterium]|nr:tRNA (N(6)-L-threonylcarbamoyladenosine(37)-C(2))-methylthiotransferase MtaB [Clostridia bacterium]